MLWPPILRLFSQRMGSEERVRYSIHMTSAVAGGTLGAYLLSAAMLQLFGWRASFHAAAAILFALAGAWLLFFRGESSMEPKNDRPVQTAPESTLPFLRLLIIPGVLLCLIPAALHGVLKDGMTSWVPTFIAEVFGTTPVLSLLISTVLPIVNLSGALLAQFVVKKITRNEILASGLFFGLSTAALFIMGLVYQRSLFFTVLMLAVITSAMLAINTLIVSVLPLRFAEHNRVATLSGLLNAVAYGGSALASALIGFLVDARGWDAAVYSWVFVALIGMLVCFFGAKARMRPQ